MRRKIFGAVLMAACLPIALQAADITVVKETPIAVGERISTTASPETNRIIREETMKARQDKKQIVAPAAKAFTDRLQVTVKPETVKENHMDLTYPRVQSVSPYVTKAINKTITDYVEKLRKQVHKMNEKAVDGEKQNLYMSYDIKADGNGIFSVTITSYMIEDNASHGVNVEKGFTFNTTTGRTLSLSDFGGLPQEKITTGLQQLPKEGKKAIYADVTAGKPNSFFARENHDIVLIYDQGTIAPMSSGSIYVPVGNLGR